MTEFLKALIYSTCLVTDSFLYQDDLKEIFEFAYDPNEFLPGFVNEGDIKPGKLPIQSLELSERACMIGEMWAYSLGCSSRVKTLFTTASVFNDTLLEDYYDEDG